MNDKPIPYRLTTEEERENMEKRKRELIQKIKELQAMGYTVAQIVYNDEEQTEEQDEETTIH